MKSLCTEVWARAKPCAISLPSSAKQASGQASISQPQVASLLVPLPSLAQQRRIVEKVDQLMALCNHLEAKLTRSRSKAEKLASAVVHHLTAA